MTVSQNVSKSVGSQNLQFPFIRWTQTLKMVHKWVSWNPVCNLIIVTLVVLIPRVLKEPVNISSTNNRTSRLSATFDWYDTFNLISWFSITELFLLSFNQPPSPAVRLMSSYMLSQHAWPILRGKRAQLIFGLSWGNMVKYLVTLQLLAWIDGLLLIIFL